MEQYHRSPVSVYQCTEDGYLIRQYRSLSEAASMSGVSLQSIRRAMVSSTHISGGFMWRDSREYTPKGKPTGKRIEPREVPDITEWIRWRLTQCEDRELLDRCITYYRENDNFCMYTDIFVQGLNQWLDWWKAWKTNPENMRLEDIAYFIYLYQRHTDAFRLLIDYPGKISGITQQLSLGGYENMPELVLVPSPTTSGPKQVIQSDMLGKTVNVFPSIAAAAKALNIDRNSIKKVLTKQWYTTHGFHFDYAPRSCSM